MAIELVQEGEREGLIKELEVSTKEWWDKFNKFFGKAYEYPIMEFDLKGHLQGRHGIGGI